MTNAPSLSEEAMQALQIVQDFIFIDAFVLLQPA